MEHPPAAVEAHDPSVHVKENQDVVSSEHPVLADGLPPNFETYLYYAREQRDKEAVEARRRGHHPPNGWLCKLFGLDQLGRNQKSVISSDEKEGISNVAVVFEVTPAEYRAASSSLKTATWGTIFFLITTGTTGPSELFAPI